MNGRSCSSSAVSDRGMESDSVFHNFLVCMELLPVLQAVLAIPNMNALPVHCANQVSKCVVFRVVFFVVLLERFRRSSGRFGCPFRVFRVPFRTHFVHF